jgi:hypothetical protein
LTRHNAVAIVVANNRARLSFAHIRAIHAIASKAAVVKDNGILGSGDGGDVKATQGNNEYAARSQHRVATNRHSNLQTVHARVKGPGRQK